MGHVLLALGYICSIDQYYQVCLKKKSLRGVQFFVCYAQACRGGSCRASLAVAQ